MKEVSSQKEHYGIDMALAVIGEVQTNKKFLGRRGLFWLLISSSVFRIPFKIGYSFVVENQLKAKLLTSQVKFYKDFCNSLHLHYL